MTEKTKTETDHLANARAKLMDAALDHVPFDGWSEASFRAAIADSGLDVGLAKSAAPRGGIDLAAAFHRRGDAQMVEAALSMDLGSLRYSERVAKLVRTRVEIAAREKEAVRRGVTLFALPIHAAEGARLIWGTADAIWTVLGDTSRDFNWYSKRAILSGVYSSTVLYWLGDQSEGSNSTWAFLDRRIDDVMRFEKTKAKMKENPLGRALAKGPLAILSRIKAPMDIPTGTPVGLPGRRS